MTALPMPLGCLCVAVVIATTHSTVARAQAPAAAAAAAAATSSSANLAPLVTEAGETHSAWRFVGFPKKQIDLPPTRFEAGEVDKTPGLKVSTESSYGTWVHPWQGRAPALLQWRWRLDEPLMGGKRPADLLTKGGDDAALKVCVMFDHDLDSVPFVERTVLRLARSVSGENLPAATVCYVWDSAGPTQRQGINPYTRRVRFITLQGRSSPLSRWVPESRDVARDFATLFADELPGGAQTPRDQLPGVTTVVIGADSDNTASRSVGWITQIAWRP